MTTQSASFTQLLQLSQLLPNHYRSDCFGHFPRPASFFQNG